VRIAGLIAIAIVALGQSATTAQLAPSKPPVEQPKPASALPLESVIVTATKPSEAAIKKFVETRAVPTYWLGRMARWDLKICPQTVGLSDTYAKYVTQRIRDIASAAGAPVNADPACRPNIEVVFTTAPQGLMDNVRKTDPLYLGFHQTGREADELVNVTNPIQAWYTTMSQSEYEHRPLGYGGRTNDVGSARREGASRLKLGESTSWNFPA
jgi:hypothetical protein